jgi:hypothetical protein
MPIFQFVSGRPILITAMALNVGSVLPGSETFARSNVSESKKVTYLKHCHARQ